MKDSGRLFWLITGLVLGGAVVGYVSTRPDDLVQRLPRQYEHDQDHKRVGRAPRRNHGRPIPRRSAQR